MCQVLDIRLTESYNFSARSHTTRKLQNLDPDQGILTWTLNYVRNCSNTGKNNNGDTGASTLSLITDKAAFWAQETWADISSGRTNLAEHVKTDCKGENLDPEVSSAKPETTKQSPNFGAISTLVFSLPYHISFWVMERPGTQLRDVLH